MIAELFVTQTHLTLDDPDGPYTCGTPQEVADWLSGHIRGVVLRPADEYRPQRYVIDLNDDSSVVVIPNPDSRDEAKVGNLNDLKSSADWNDESEAWVLVGGQPNADRFLAVLGDVMAMAPHPVDVILTPKGTETKRWADTILEARSGKHGPEARRAAHEVWTSAERHRAETFNPEETN